MMPTLSDEQRAAAEASSDAPLLILAGPGSGKTTTLLYRILHLRPMLASNEALLLLTFSNSAVQEMSMRLRTHGIPETICHVLTFHSFAFKLIKANYAQAGFLQPPRVVSPTDRINILKDCISNLGNADLDTIRDDRKRLIETLRLISAAKRSNDPESHLKNCSATFRELFVRYREKMRERSWAEFDDMVPLALDMLRTHSQLLSYYRKLYKFCLCDEFQDTNACQRELLLMLGVSGRITAVGDPNQLIYAFQGADVTNFEHFQTHFNPHRAVNVMTLQTNYRSSGPIIRLCNAILQSNPDDARPLSIVPSKGMETGCNVEIVECVGSPDCQLRFVTSKILELLRAQAVVRSASEIAVLCRDNETVQRIGKFIREHGGGIRISMSLTADEGAVVHCHLIFYR